MTARIVIADANPAATGVLVDILETAGCVVDTVRRVERVLDAVRRTASLLLISRSLPGVPDVLTLCRMLQQSPHRVPVIVTAADDVAEQRVSALRAGADDYIALSFTREEVQARVEALLRRMQPRVETVRLGSTVIEFEHRLVTTGQRTIVLTDREFAVLELLASRRGGVVTRDELLQMVWGYSPASLTRTVDNCMLRLRRKLEQDPHHPMFIRKVYGDGYRLVATE
jgi:DNA-binding response OmpR family regulator